MQEQLTRMDKRLARIEQMLRETLAQVPPPESKRITEKEVVAKYGISKHTLRRLRLGYKAGNGADVPAMLFNWGHRNGRSFDYDRSEVDALLSRKPI